MIKSITIENAGLHERQLIISLLAGDNLPVEDLPASLDSFLVAIAENNIAGVIGLEQYENYGLLRSLVVRKEFRNSKIASQLIREIEIKAMMSGIDDLYLFTETAPQYFESKGYKKVGREDVPRAVQASTEFNSVCPVSAIVMKKSLPGR